MFVLKANYPAFVVTAEGPFEYHKFRHGEIYDQVPPGEAYKFESLESITGHRKKIDPGEDHQAKGGKSK